MADGDKNKPDDLDLTEQDLRSNDLEVESSADNGTLDETTLEMPASDGEPEIDASDITEDFETLDPETLPPIEDDGTPAEEMTESDLDLPEEGELTADEEGEPDEEEEDLEEKAKEAKERLLRRVDTGLWIAYAAFWVIFVGVCAYCHFTSGLGAAMTLLLVGSPLLAVLCVPLLLWTGRRTNTVYDMLLAVSLAAVLLAVFFLVMEWASYKFDTGADDAKQRVAAPAVQLGPASTRAAAWPIDVRFTSTATGAEEAIGWPWMT